MDLKSYLKESLTLSARNLDNLSRNDEIQAQVIRATELIIDSYKNSGCLFIAGNGGSAADAQHIAAEMVAKLARDRTSLPAYAMTVDSSLLTAVGNDYGYDFVFSRQVQGLCKSKDIFLGITTSGNSGNIIKALEQCRSQNVKTILLSGKDGGLAVQKNLADVVILASGSQTAEIQEAHMAIYHSICFMVEKSLVESGHVKYF